MIFVTTVMVRDVRRRVPVDNRHTREGCNADAFALFSVQVANVVMVFLLKLLQNNPDVVDAR